MNHKGRKTTRANLEKMFNENTKNSQIAIELLLKISDGKIDMERMAIYESDDIYFNEEFYGEYKDIGITVRFQKKQLGITGKYYIFIETDTETVEFKTRIACKAWNLCVKQENIKDSQFVAKDETLDDLLNQLTEDE